MTENSFNMKSFRHRIFLDKSAEEVYKYIGTGSGFTKWFIGKSVYTYGNKTRGNDEFVQKGDNYHFEWLEKDFSVSGTVLFAEQDKKLVFTFGSLFIVTITVIEENGRTLFTLSQEYTDDAKPNDFGHINCCVCWAFFVINLKSVIEFGNDLRETHSDNEELVNR